MRRNRTGKNSAPNFTKNITKQSNKMYEIDDNKKTTRQKTSRKHITSHSVFIVLVTLLMSILRADTAAIQTKFQAYDYLSKFSYLLQDSGNPASGTLKDDSTMTQAIKDFQSFEGASVNGQLDNATLQSMSLPRCGVKDTNNYEIDNRSKRYATLGSIWPRKTLTYQIYKYTQKLTKEDIDAEIFRAFKLWSDHADLTFTAIETGPADIQLQFVGSDNPYYRNIFDGPGDVVAVANPPNGGGDILFDDSEGWTIDSSSGENLLYTATHEIGHSLGLNHSNIKSAVMGPNTRPFSPHLELDIDDILGIQALYGKKTIQSEICKNSTIDTIFNSYDGDTFAFKGKMLYKITNYSVADGYPKYISEGWPGLPSDIDAAFTYKYKTYFFKGAKYWRYSDRNIDSGYPKKISEGFPGIPDHLDAAMFWGRNRMIYFYKASDVWRLNLATKVAIRENISTWKGLPSDLDAALYTHGSTYFFKGDKYYRFNENTFAIYNNDPPYPRPSAHRWFGCPIIV